MRRYTFVRSPSLLRWIYIFKLGVIDVTTNRRRFKKPSRTDFWIRTANNFTLRMLCPGVIVFSSFSCHQTTTSSVHERIRFTNQNGLDFTITNWNADHNSYDRVFICWHRETWILYEWNYIEVGRRRLVVERKIRLNTNKLYYRREAMFLKAIAFDVKK